MDLESGAWTGGKFSKYLGKVLVVMGLDIDRWGPGLGLSGAKTGCNPSARTRSSPFVTICYGVDILSLPLTVPNSLSFRALASGPMIALSFMAISLRDCITPQLFLPSNAIFRQVPLCCCHLRRSLVESGRAKVRPAPSELQHAQDVSSSACVSPHGLRQVGVIR
jgi:hypothetical protein